MRLIWSTDQIDDINHFSALLNRNHITHSLEGIIDTDWAQDTYGNKTFHVWIHDEDQTEQAQQLLQAFLKDPKDPQYVVKTRTSFDMKNPESLTKQFLEKKLQSKIYDINPAKLAKSPVLSENSTRRMPAFIFSKAIILLCSLILFIDLWMEREVTSIPPAARNLVLTVSPIEQMLLYDYPLFYELLFKITSQYGYDSLMHVDTLPLEGKQMYNESLKHPPWEGVYPKIVSSMQEFFHTQKGPQLKQQKFKQSSQLFEKIRQGQVWRSITPIFLHADILHLLFNMIWVVVLGFQIEERILVKKYLIVILICALVSNTAQYLISGPAFLGYSGVICGMAFFIRARQKMASWEGYQMASATFHFIVFFISMLAGLSLLTFFIETIQGTPFPMQIANTAHLAGAATGWILGHMKVFHWNKRPIP